MVGTRRAECRQSSNGWRLISVDIHPDHGRSGWPHQQAWMGLPATADSGKGDIYGRIC